MKKALTLLLLSAMLTAPLAGCGDTADTPAETTEGVTQTTDNPGSEAPTEKQIWLPCTRFDVQENSKYTYYYDEYGNEIKLVQEDVNGNQVAAWLREYDENHNLIKRTVDTGDGTPFVQLIITYNENRNPIERREFTTTSESVYTYQYDEQNRMIAMVNGDYIVEFYTYKADGSYKVQYDGDPGDYSLYSADGKVLERHYDAETKSIYTYNDDGVLIEATIYSGNKTPLKTVYHLDEHGNAIRVAYVFSSGNETVISEYEYKLYTVKVK